MAYKLYYFLVFEEREGPRGTIGRIKGYTRWPLTDRHARSNVRNFWPCVNVGFLTTILLMIAVLYLYSCECLA